MDVETIMLIVSTVATAISVILCVVANAKKAKAQKLQASSEEAQVNVDEEYNNLVKIGEVIGTIPNTINEAEKLFGSGNGFNKLTWVIQKTMILALKQGVDISEETITAEVETYLSTPQKHTEINSASNGISIN